MRGLWTLALHTGMRRGELAGLRWTDVDLDGGTLTIGLVSTAKYFLPQFLARFKQEHFGIQIKLEVRNREQMVELLREGEIDLAIMGRASAYVHRESGALLGPSTGYFADGAESTRVDYP